MDMEEFLFSYKFTNFQISWTLVISLYHSEKIRIVKNMFILWIKMLDPNKLEPY